jgi:small subunit ribosomal protein S8
MSLQDPISDMLTVIRNGQMVRREVVSTPASKLKVAILKIFEDEGYILGFQENEQDNKPTLQIFLKYHNNKPVIETLKRVSKPGLRIYKKKDELPKVLGGLGIAVISTPKGVMSDKQARSLGQGGEILCQMS